MKIEINWPGVIGFLVQATIVYCVARWAGTEWALAVIAGSIAAFANKKK